MEGEVATRGPLCLEKRSGRLWGGRLGCIDPALDRFAAGFLFVSAGEMLSKATICRFCGCVWRRWIVCGAVRTG